MRSLNNNELKEISGGIFTTKDGILVIVPKGDLSEMSYNRIDGYFEKAFNNEISWKSFEKDSIFWTSQNEFNTYILNFSVSGSVLNLK